MCSQLPWSRLGHEDSIASPFCAHAPFPPACPLCLCSHNAHPRGTSYHSATHPASLANTFPAVPMQRELCAPTAANTRPLPPFFDHHCQALSAEHVPGPVPVALLMLAPILMLQDKYNVPHSAGEETRTPGPQCFALGHMTVEKEAVTF